LNSEFTIKNVKDFYKIITHFINNIKINYYKFFDELNFDLPDLTKEQIVKYNRINKEIEAYNKIIDLLVKELNKSISNNETIHLLFNNDNSDKKYFDFFFNLNKEKLDKLVLKENLNM